MLVIALIFIADLSLNTSDQFHLDGKKRLLGPLASAEGYLAFDDSIGVFQVLVC